MTNVKQSKNVITKEEGHKTMSCYNIFSWNVNGIRAIVRKSALQQLITDANPDILCIQETKAKQGQAEIDLPEYEEIWNSAKRAGYSGTAIFTKIKPIQTFGGFTDDINIQYDWEMTLMATRSTKDAS